MVLGSIFCVIGLINLVIDFTLLIHHRFDLMLRPKFSDSTKLNLAESVKMLAEAQDATGNVMEYFYFRLKPFLRIFTASRKPHLPTVITRSIGLKFL